MKEIIITKMSLADINRVDEIDRLSFPIPWSKSSFEDEITNMLATYLVAKIDDVVVGYIGTRFIIDECHFMNIAVHPDYRNLGVANKLVEEIFKLCNENMITYALLEVRATNIPAQNLYKKFGFKVDGVRKLYYKNPDGTREDAILMTKEF